MTEQQQTAARDQRILALVAVLSRIVVGGLTEHEQHTIGMELQCFALECERDQIRVTGKGIIDSMRAAVGPRETIAALDPRD